MAMPRVDQTNYRTLIIAGCGTIGKSVLRLGQAEIAGFDSAIVIDKYFAGLPAMPGKIDFRLGDIENPGFLKNLCETVRMPCLLLNVAAGTDNIAIRKIISAYDMAYLDSCASSLPGKKEYRFSRYMPYTFTPIVSRFPHWLCWGINPGLVEIIARKLIREIGCEKETTFDVSIYESDQLHADWKGGAVAVGWSPEMLIEEVMVSPTLQVRGGRSVEREAPGTDKIVAFWGGSPVPSRIVGHEDIWNIGLLKSVEQARFIYGLHPKVMDVLDGKPDDACRVLKVPDESTALFGMERIAVKVERSDNGQSRSVVWETDHEAVRKKYSLNAVQYQTGKSLLLAIRLLQNTHYGRCAISACASNLRIGEPDWKMIEEMMYDLSIDWRDGDAYDLHAVPEVNLHRSDRTC
jgi:hypothetical protein